MKAPADKATTYVIVVIIALIVLYVIIGVIARALV
jgi:TRAP-type C4-dicarboxylate transport system permease small subunit